MKWKRKLWWAALHPPAASSGSHQPAVVLTGQEASVFHGGEHKKTSDRDTDPGLPLPKDLVLPYAVD